MLFFIGLFVGIAIGITFGVFAMCAMYLSKKCDDVDTK